jgi:hypothetical protein
MPRHAPRAGYYAEMTVVPPAAPGPAPSPRTFRPIVLGPILLHRRRSDDRWRVDVSRDGRLLPLLPASGRDLWETIRARRRTGRLCRIAAALLSPEDTVHAGIAPPPPRHRFGLRQPQLASYGWALVYQPPGVGGLAFVDRHEQFADLPACFELPLELLDRAAFLAERGFRTRPLAVVTQPEDFDDHGRHRFSCGGTAEPLSQPASFWPPTDPV